MDMSNIKYWSEMNEEERDQFLNTIECVMSKVSDEDDVDWRDMERMDAYRDAVHGRIGQSEQELLEQSALFDEDLADQFSKHCDRAFRLGITEVACARQWRCRA